MARPKSTPSYCLHKPTGLAYATFDGQVIYFGEHGTDLSRQRYDQQIATWLANGRRLPARGKDVSVEELVAAFWAHAEAFYRNSDGTPAGELDNFRCALRPLRRLFGETLAVEFGPLKLKAVRAEAIKPYTGTYIEKGTGKVRTVTRPGWARTSANRQIARIKHVFKWGTENELIPPAVYQALATVSGLRAGKSDARETEPVQPVDDADVEKVLPRLSPQVKAMVELEAITGMRPSEVCMMRGADIDRADTECWLYKPERHKTAHHGIDRVIPLGRRCQEIIAQFPKTGYLFSPAEAEAWRREQQAKNREDEKLTPSRKARMEAAKRRQRRRPFRDRYDDTSYRRAITRACGAAGVAHWTPNRLRHAVATKLREQYGLDVAQVVLGHARMNTTQIYAKANVKRAMEVMKQVG